MCRCAEELPWLLKRAELKGELYNTILNIDILLQLYSRYICNMIWIEVRNSVVVGR
jgi:hypothetical protein